LNTVRAGRAALVGRQRRIAFDIFYFIEFDAQLFRSDLWNGDAQALTEIDLSAAHGHRAVTVHG